MTALTKSKYITGLSCINLLWHEFNAPDKILDADEGAKERMQAGIEVGHLAKKLHPKGVEIPYGSGAVHLTKEALKKRVPLFEASFCHGDCYCKVDLLVPVHDDEWDLYEVKSTTKVKDDHVEDVSFQRYVLQNAGLKVRKAHLMFINNEYVKKGAIDVKKFFESEDITDLTDKPDEVEANVKRFLKIIQGKKPKVKYGEDCKDSLECPVCAKEIEDAEITKLVGFTARSYALLNQGIRTFKDLPKDIKLTDKQKIQIAKKPVVNKEAVDEFFKKIKYYPLYCLDFETFAHAIPLHDGTRPYQAVPFQFSLHIYDNGMHHKEFLADGTEDPRKALIEALKVIGPKGSVLMYTSYERRVLEDLADYSKKDAKWIHDIINRLVDLSEPFRSFDMYHPAQEGSYSIKALTPFTGITYGELDISEGTMAQREYVRITYGKVPKEEKARIRKALLEYCKQDTDAMVELVESLNFAGALKRSWVDKTVKGKK